MPHFLIFIDHFLVIDSGLGGLLPVILGLVFQLSELALVAVIRSLGHHGLRLLGVLHRLVIGLLTLLEIRK